MTNVVKMWRQRSLLLGRNAWTCTECQRASMVARRACAGCGAIDSQELRPLPRVGKVVATTTAGAAVENLDQVTGRKHALVVELPGGTRLPVLLAHSDSALIDELPGKSVRLGVRRLSLGEIPAGEPISYCLKATVDHATRLGIKADRNEESS